MPSQPDYDRAYQLSPQLRPKDRADILQEQNEQLVQELAKAQGRSPDDVRQDLTGGAHIDASADATDAPAQTAEVSQAEANFFASKEGTKYFPIEQLPDSGIADPRFFRTEEEAQAQNYVAA